MVSKQKCDGYFLLNIHPVIMLEQTNKHLACIVAILEIISDNFRLLDNEF